MCVGGGAASFLIFFVCFVVVGVSASLSVPSRLPPDDRDRASGEGELRTGLMPSSPGGGKADGALLPSLGGTLGFGDVEPTGAGWCEVCNKHFATRSLYDNHLNGHTHKSNIAKLCSGGLQPGGGLHPILSQRITTLLDPVQPRQTDHD